MVISKIFNIVIRLAVETDQPVIVALIREAQLNPRNLQWPRFLVAEDQGKIVGIRQVKIHKKGTREVGSGYVIPEYRRQGISSRLMNEILSRESGPLYLMCDKKWAEYYERFGFQKVNRVELPADFKLEYRIGKIITTLLSLVSSHKVNIIPMKRDI